MPPIDPSSASTLKPLRSILVSTTFDPRLELSRYVQTSSIVTSSMGASFASDTRRGDRQTRVLRASGDTAWMQWDEVEPERLFEVIRARGPAADAERTVWTPFALLGSVFGVIAVLVAIVVALAALAYFLA